MTSREQALKNLQMLSFALYDVSLFLDTHPNDRMALEYYNKYKALSERARREFVEKYGPLSIADVDIKNGWNWVNDPWPWQIEEND